MTDATTTSPTVLLPSEKLCGIVCALATQYKFPAHQRASVDLQRNLDVLNTEVKNWAETITSNGNTEGSIGSSESTAKLADQLYNVGCQKLMRREISFNGKSHFYLSSWAPDFKLLLLKTISSCLHQLNQFKLERQRVAEADQPDKSGIDNNKRTINVYYSATSAEFTQPICEGIGIWNLVKEAESVESTQSAENVMSRIDAINSLEAEKTEQSGRKDDWEEF